MSAQTQKTEVFGLDNDANVEDFMSRFADPHTYVSPQEANQRFNQLSQANHPELRNAVGSYVSQMDPESFTQAARNLDSNERTGFATRLVTALKGMGIDLGPVAQALGLSSTDPQQMAPEDLGRLAGYAQQNAPTALQQTAQEQSFIFKALGNPLVQGALAILAARYMANRHR